LVVTTCLEHAKKENPTGISQFNKSKSKTHQKSEKSKKGVLTHSSGPQSKMNQLFCCPNSPKSFSAYSACAAYANKDFRQ
jgi:hypothetical protein